MKTRHSLFLLLYFLFLLSACNKKSDDPSPSTTDNESVAKGKLYMHLHNFWGVEEIQEYDSLYRDEKGRKASFRTAQCYLSNLQLIKLDGSAYSLDSKIILKVQENTTYTLGEIPVGNYKALRFSIGLDEVTNSQLTSSSSDVLNTPSMWFSNPPQPNGYVFFHLQGKIDTTTNANGSVADMQPFQIKLGTKGNLKQRTLPDFKMSIMENQAQYLHMRIDHSRLFTGLELKNPNNLSILSQTDNGSDLAKKMADNLPSMFLFVE